MPQHFGKSAFFAILGAIVLLFALQFAEQHFQWQHEWIKPLSFNQLLPKKGVNTIQNEGIDSVATQDSTYSIAVDTAFESDTIQSDSTSTNQHFLTAFIKALQSADSQQVRIAYFGDSQIEGDLITQHLRELLQQKYGGSGIGYVPITSVSAQFRYCIKHQFNEQWNRYNALTIKAPKSIHYDLGLQVQTPKPNQFASFTLTTKPIFERVSTLPFIDLLYGGRVDTLDRQDSVFITSGQYSTSLVLNNTTGLHHERLNLVQAKSLQLQFKADSARPIYGISAQSKTGVILDNYAARGSTGLPIGTISPVQWRAFNRYFDYNLVVLQFGLNMANHKPTNKNWYKSGLIQVIQRIRKNVPNASILVVGVGDKASKTDGELVTDSSIAPILAAQQAAAFETQSAFFNLYEFMQSEGGIIDWADRDKPLANKDYAHVNYRGSKKIAQAIFNSIIEADSTYQFTQNNTAHD